MFRQGLLSTLLYLSMSTCLHAELLVSESFNYDVGDLDGQNGGSGFAEEWLVLSDFTFEVVQTETPMQYAVPGGGTIHGGDRALRFGNDTPDIVLENEVEALSRRLSNPIENDEVYFSFLYRYDVDGFIDNNDFVVWWFTDDTGPQVGLKGNGGDGSVDDDLVGRVNNQFAPPQQAMVLDTDISEDSETLGVDYLIVAKLSKAGNTEIEDDYDELSIWVNPSADAADDPHEVAFGDPSNEFDRPLAVALEVLGMRVFSQEPGDAMYWDELRVGTSWEDVISPTGEPSLQGDFNMNGVLDSGDIDDLTQQSASQTHPIGYDLNADAQVNSQDVTLWIKDLYGSWIGDANLDGEFNSGDLVAVLASGAYETGANAAWSTGDFNGDGQANTSDLVTALSDGGYEQGPRAAVASVPEPHSALLWLIGGLTISCLSGQSRHRGRA